MSLEQFLENFTLEEIEELKRLKLEKQKSYSYSKITFSDLHNLVELKKRFDDKPFKEWFESEISIKSEDLEFLENLIFKYGKFLRAYKEETLKANFIIPIINRVDFLSLEKEISNFYDEPIEYKSDKFTITGEVDFVISKGLEYSEKPYFFIQEFKKGKENSDPEPQLLAELIAGVELNSWQSIKGAYIIGSIWNFVILERLEKHKYIYYVSSNFDSSKIDDLTAIYKNLLFVKAEIIKDLK